MPGDTDSASTRLQVVLSTHGVTSRRHAAEMIKAGRVAVDGEIVLEPGFRVPDTAESVTVDGIEVGLREPVRIRTIMLNKPAGLICSADDERGPTVFECLGGIDERLVTAGRLDKDSEGLLILSNDGDLINHLTHPRFGHTKKYMVTVRGDMSGEVLEFLAGMRELEDGTPIAPVSVEYVDSPPRRYPPRHRLVFVLGEGKNRQIRRMCRMAGLRVEKLVRLEICRLRLPRDLRPGEWRDLSDRELRLLFPE